MRTYGTATGAVTPSQRQLKAWLTSTLQLLRSILVCTLLKLLSRPWISTLRPPLNEPTASSVYILPAASLSTLRPCCADQVKPGFELVKLTASKGTTVDRMFWSCCCWAESWPLLLFLLLLEALLMAASGVAEGTSAIARATPPLLLLLLKLPKLVPRRERKLRAASVTPHSAPDALLGSS